MAGAVVFPKTGKGDRSTTALHKTVFSELAAALGDAGLASAVASEKDWRHRYAQHLDRLAERLVIVGAADAKAALAAVRAACERARGLEVEAEDGSCRPLAEAMAQPARLFQSVRVEGSGTAVTEFAVPYNNRELHHTELEAQLDRWAAAGAMEPDCAAAAKRGFKQVASLRGRTFMVLGAGSELGPVRLLLEAGATVVAVGTRKPERWADLIALARRLAGTLVVPVAEGAGAPGDDDGKLAAAAGADLTTQGPAIAEWLLRCAGEAQGPITLGTYLYADGEANVRLTAVADFVAEQLAALLGPGRASFAWLASCSTTLVIPEEAAQAQAAAQAACREQSAWWQRLSGVPQRSEPVELEQPLESGGGKLVRLYRGFEVLQGPNYALAQLMRQWRAMLLHAEGFVVSTPVTPMCRTFSVCHSATMAALLDGVAYTKPLEAYEPETCRNVMLAILISDLLEPVPKLPTPLHLFARKAFHSGLWRCPYQMSSLGTPTWLLGKLWPKKAASEERAPAGPAAA